MLLWGALPVSEIKREAGVHPGPLRQARDLAPALVVQLGYTQAVSGLAFSPDGDLALAGSFSGTARLWHLPTGLELRRFDGHTGGVVAAAFSPDGREILTGSNDGTARLWESSTGREIRVFESEYATPVYAVAFSPDGRLLLMGALGGPARLVDRATGEEVMRVQGTPAGAPYAALSPDGLRLVTAGPTPGMQVWDAASGTQVTTFGADAPPLALPGALAFTEDGRRVLAGHADGVVRAWDPGTGEVTQTFEGHTGGVSSLDLSPDGRVMLTVSNQDGWAILWDTDTGELRRRLGGGARHLWAARLSPDATQVLGGSVTSVALYRVDDGSVVRTMEGLSDRIQDVGFSPDGSQMLVSDVGMEVHLWNREAGTRRARLPGMYGVFSPDGAYTAVFDAAGSVAEIRDPSTDTVIRRIAIDEGPLAAVTVSPDGTMIATRGWSDATVSVWNTATGDAASRLASPGDETVQALAFLPGGDRLVAVGNGVRVWNLASGSTAARIEGLVGLDVAAFPDGRRILVGGGNLVQVIDLETGEIRSLTGHGGHVYGVALSPDGLLAASASEDRTVRIWEVETGTEIDVLTGHGDAVEDVAFSPDGLTILSGSRDGTARLWDAASGDQLASLVALQGDSWVVVAPDGRFDTDDIEAIRGVHWVMADEPFTPLPIEVFMQEYFEPRLLGRLLEGEELRPVRNLEALNRVQPVVALAGIARRSDSTVSVTVEVGEGSRLRGSGSQSRLVRSGARDLRLFRDGQLVAWRDGPLDIDEDGRTSFQFDSLPLPRRAGAREVVFSAYAFNDDQVKSPTVGATMELAATPAPRRGVATVITVGVDAYESSAWDLSFAANDARLLSAEVVARLQASGAFEDVVSVPLVSSHDPSKTTDATKATIRGVLALLAGGYVSPEVRRAIPSADRIRSAGPDDLVLLSFSSHGYRDAEGTFFLFPSDIGVGVEKTVGPEVLQRAVSSEELTGWLRPIDAGELVLVVDACHSAAAVEGAGFKPGPMGSRGLGQLAYDKGMRVLAASQAEDVALESDILRQGLLTYALVRDGLLANQADARPADGSISLTEWLRYGVARVPSLYAEVQEGSIQTFGYDARSVEVGAPRPDPHFQQPSLFDFRRGGMVLSLSGR
jgi:WD40 repeat protein